MMAMKYFDKSISMSKDLEIAFQKSHFFIQKADDASYYGPEFLDSSQSLQCTLSPSLISTVRLTKDYMNGFLKSGCFGVVVRS